jgi:hypothetical protein
MRHIKSVLFVGILLIFATSVHAKGSYLGFGVGILPDMYGLGAAIMADGLDGGLGNPALVGCSEGSPECRRENPGDKQKIVISEKDLLVLQDYTNDAIQTEANGALMGLVLNIFWESESDNTFWRVGFDYNRKLSGGHTESRLLGIKWYDLHIDGENWMIPFYYGFKAGVGEKASVYMGAGINLWTGYYSIDFTNIGDFPTAILGTPVGLTTVTDAEGTTKGGPVVGESVKLQAKGYGFNVVLGVEAKLGTGNDKLFLEIDYKLAGAQSESGRIRTAAGVSHVAPMLVYPVVFGMVYRFGYKMAM